MHFEAFGLGPLQVNDSWETIPSGLASFWDLIASLESPSTEHVLNRVLALGSALRMTDMAEIEGALEPCRRLLASFHPGNMLKSVAVRVLGDLLHRALQLWRFCIAH
jgi:hypothetical protein